jgi:2,5-diketo-D-gluconate reductase A
MSTPSGPPTPELTLNNGVRIPQLGFGVFQVPPDEVIEPVATALASGYRLIDTAAAYGNEEGVGTAIKQSGIPRDDLFITTKLWNTDQGYDSTLRAFDASLDKLGLERLDLYLIHWPLPKRDKYVDTWRALEKLYADGRVRAIGVSNFTEHHLNRLREETEIRPAINQVELHPRFAQEALRDYHDEYEIATEAWSPIGQGQGLLDDPAIAGVAKAKDRSPAQVVLRWHMQHGIVAIPKSVTPERIRANLQVFDFELSDEEMSIISGLSAGKRIGPDPEKFDYP